MRWWWHMLLHDGSNLWHSQVPIHHNEERMRSQRPTQCPLSKTGSIPNIAHYSSKWHRGQLDWPHSIRLYVESIQQLCFQYGPANEFNWHLYAENMCPRRESFWIKNAFNHFCSLLVCKLLTVYICFHPCLVREGCRHRGSASRHQATGLQGSPVSTAGAVPSWSRPTPLRPAHYFQP